MTHLEDMDRNTRKLEIKRLESIKDDFLAEYKVICEKYTAQLRPIFAKVGDTLFHLTQQIDTYVPPAPAQAQPEAVVDNTNSKESEPTPPAP